jgi:hypothetical protein
MNLKEFGIEALGCIEIDENKMAQLLVDKVIIASLHKIVDDTSNPFDNQALAIVAPLLAPKVKEVVAELIAKIEVVA